MRQDKNSILLNVLSIVLLLVYSGYGYSLSPAQSHYDYKPLFEKINHELETQQLPGMVVVVMHNGKIRLHEAFGYADIDQKVPMTKDRLFRLFSMTKPITAIATMKWMHDNEKPLSTPLQQFYPEFDTQPPIPIYSLLNHTSGMSYGFKINRIAGWKYLFSGISSSESLVEFMETLSDLPLLSAPGERWRYSFSSDVQGALIEKMTKRPLHDYMLENLFSPLNMTNTHFYLDTDSVEKLVPMYNKSWFSSTYNKEDIEDHLTDENTPQSGGGGLISTALDYMNFVKLLMYPEHYQHVISPQLVNQMQTNQLADGIKGVPERLYTNSGFGYGIGVKLKDEMYLSKDSIYWAGKGGTVFWADKQKDLAVVAMMQVAGGNRDLEKWLVPTVYEWLDSIHDADQPQDTYTE